MVLLGVRECIFVHDTMAQKHMRSGGRGHRDARYSKCRKFGKSANCPQGSSRVDLAHARCPEGSSRTKNCTRDALRASRVCKVYTRDALRASRRFSDFGQFRAPPGVRKLSPTGTSRDVNPSRLNYARDVDGRWLRGARQGRISPVVGPGRLFWIVVGDVGEVGWARGDGSRIL